MCREKSNTRFFIFFQNCMYVCHNCMYSRVTLVLKQLSSLHAETWDKDTRVSRGADQISVGLKESNGIYTQYHIMDIN